MIRPSVKGQRLTALFLLGCLLFNDPVLSLFSTGAKIFGVPLLYAYIFAAWALLIALIAFVIEKLVEIALSWSAI